MNKHLSGKQLVFLSLVALATFGWLVRGEYQAVFGPSSSPGGGTTVTGTSPGMAQPVRPLPTTDPSRPTTTQTSPVGGMSAIRQMD